MRKYLPKLTFHLFFLIYSPFYERTNKVKSIPVPSERAVCQNSLLFGKDPRQFQNNHDRINLTFSELKLFTIDL